MEDDLRKSAGELLDFPSDEPVTRAVIIEALVRMPEDVRDFALARCTFVSTDEPDGQTPVSDRFLVVLEEPLDEAAVMHVVAHAWLSRDGSGGSADTGDDEVAELVAQWEFTGPGADA